jgi:glyoxylase-like metal-dependent hydrolase (beta-lactamase superfamily II)
VLSYEATGQRIERCGIDGTVDPGSAFVAGGREWEVLAAPGHDPHSVLFFDRANGLLVSADALWENGFGLVFPEIAGEPGFDDVGATLEMIAALPVKRVVPGHGAPFADVRGALDRAFERLRGLKADPARHARHALKVLIKYHLMEERSQDEAALLAWAGSTPLLAGLWQRFPPRGLPSAAAWAAAAVQEMVQSGALRREGALVLDA